MLPAVKLLKLSVCPVFAPPFFKIIASAALFPCNYLCHSVEDGFPNWQAHFPERMNDGQF